MSISRELTRPMPTSSCPSDDMALRPTADVRGGPHHTPPPSTSPLPTFERYEIIGELGRGGMGVVFKAIDRDLKRPVAIKMILHGNLAAFDALTRFKAETEAIGRLDHPNLVRIYETGHVDGRPFAVMEFIEGGTLADHIAYRTFTPDESARIIADLADAVESAHRSGVLHRDLKPANILLRGEQPKVVDFGLAKLEGAVDCTQTGDVIGTPNYMAPERVTGPKSAIGSGVDIYALGAILFEMLTKHPPFEGATPVEVLRLVVDRDPPSVRSFRRDVNRDLDTICLKCLHKKPSQRYATAKELADDLRRYLRGEPIQARPITTLERFGRWTKRHPTIAVALALLFTVLAGIAVASTLAAQSYRELAANEKTEKERADQERDEARWRTYQGNMAAVASHLQLNNYGTAKSALERAPQEFQGWEWHYFNACLDVRAHEKFYGGSHVQTAQLTDRGNTILFRLDAKLEWVSSRTGERQQTVAVPEQIAYYALSPDEKTLLYSTFKGQVRLLDRTAQTTTELRVDDIKNEGDGSWDVEWSRCGRYAVASRHERGTLCVFDVQTLQRRVITFPEPIVGHPYQSKDNEFFISGNKEHYWCSYSDGRIVHRLPTTFGAARLGAVSPDGRYLVLTYFYPNNAVRVWDTTTRQLVATLDGHKNFTMWLTFTSDGQRLLTASNDQTLRIWDLRTFQPLHKLEGHSQGVSGVVVTPDNRTAITGSSDGTVRLWDIATGAAQAVIHGQAKHVLELLLHTDGKTLIVNTGVALRWYDLEAVRRRTFLGKHDDFVYHLALDADGRTLASAGWDQKVRSWDIATGHAKRVFHQPQARMATGVAFHPNRPTLIAITRDPDINASAVHEWDRHTGQLITQHLACTGNWQTDTVPAFSPDRQWLALGGEVGFVRLAPSSAATGTNVAKYHIRTRATNLPMLSVVGWHPHSKRFASGGEDGSIIVWDRDTTTPQAEWPGHTGVVHDVRYSADGRWLLTAGNDGAVNVWDATTFAKHATLNHGSRIYQIALHPTEPRLAAACADGSIRLWDTDRWEEVAELRGHTSYVKSVLFTPDGTRLLSGSGDGTIRIWDKRPMRQE